MIGASVVVGVGDSSELCLLGCVECSVFRGDAEDFIEARFERVEGVSDSNVMGGREEEMQVIVDPEKLAARAGWAADRGFVVLL